MRLLSVLIVLVGSLVLVGLGSILLAVGMYQRMRRSFYRRPLTAEEQWAETSVPKHPLATDPS